MTEKSKKIKKKESNSREGVERIGSIKGSVKLLNNCQMHKDIYALFNFHLVSRYMYLSKAKISAFNARLYAVAS